MRRSLIIGLLAFLTVTGLDAAVYRGDAFAFHQPDGSTFPVRLWGDEFAVRAESADGWTVIRGADRWWSFARPAAGGGIEASALRVGAGDPASLGVARHLSPSPAQRAASVTTQRQLLHRDARGRPDSPRIRQARAVQRAAAPAGSPAPPSTSTTGTRKGLTLMIKFPDLPGEAVFTKAQVEDFCNGDAYTEFGNNGSVKAYFADNSLTRLTYTNSVINYYTALHDRSYYTDPLRPYGEAAQELIIEALEATDDAGFDFSTCDGDDDGIIDGVNAFYAGATINDWAEGLWPHMSTIAWSSASGLDTGAYQITDMGTSLTLGTFCHENGHMICGFPDVYDYDSGLDSSFGGAGMFCLMNSGGHGTNPVRICGYLALAAGWRDATDLAGGISGSRTVIAESATIFRHKKSLTEYFLIENRNTASASGRDADLPASGLAIWHCDELGNHNDQRYAKNAIHANYEVALVQADNRHDFEQDPLLGDGNDGDSRDLWYLGNGAPGYTNRFEDGDGVDPEANDARWWDGTVSDLLITNISAAGLSMSFTVGETTLSLAAAAYSMAEGDSGTTEATISVVRTGSLASSASLTWTAGDGTATLANLDHPGSSGTLTWAKGVGGAKTFKVKVNGDTHFESDETILIHITPTAGILSDLTDAVLTVTNDDPMPPPQGSIELAAYVDSVSEDGGAPAAGARVVAGAGIRAAGGAGGGGTLAVQVLRVGGSTGDVTVTYTTSSGTATAGVDFIPVSGTLTWLDGDADPKTINIQTIADAIPEADETFLLTLGETTGGAIVPTPKTLTAAILNDDYGVGFASSSMRVYEPATGIVNIPVTVRHSGAIHGTFTVNYHVAFGTATSGTDFSAIAPGTLTWDASTTTDPSILVPVIADDVSDGIETLFLIIDGPVDAILDGPNTIGVEIADLSYLKYSGAVDGRTGENWLKGGCGSGASALLLGLAVIGLGLLPRRLRRR